MSDHHYANGNSFDHYYVRMRMSEHDLAVFGGILITIMLGGGCRNTTTLVGGRVLITIMLRGECRNTTTLFGGGVLITILCSEEDAETPLRCSEEEF